MQPRLLLFGASGAIGGATAEHFRARGWRVVSATRHAATAAADFVSYDPLHDKSAAVLAPFAPYDAVCFAQGANLNDSIYDVDLAKHRELYDANCTFVIAALNALLKENLLAAPARLCIISSIWQDIARQNKLSYGVSKAAVQGLVLSAAADLAKDGHMINAVLPGVLDTPMTRANLQPEQIKKFEDATQFSRLPKLADVAAAVYFFCSPENQSITGQFVKVDLGFSDVRIV